MPLETNTPDLSSLLPPADVELEPESKSQPTFKKNDLKLALKRINRRFRIRDAQGFKPKYKIKEAEFDIP